MMVRDRFLLVCAGALSLAGCLETASLDNDKGASDVSELLAQQASASATSTTGTQGNSGGSVGDPGGAVSVQPGGAGGAGVSSGTGNPQDTAGAGTSGAAGTGAPDGTTPESPGGTGSGSGVGMAGGPDGAGAGTGGTGAGTGAGGAGTGAGGTGMDTAGSGTAGMGGGADPGGAGTGAGTDTGMDMSGPADPPAPMPQLVAGTATAAGCYSYTESQGGMCGSYFCGVDEATLGQALDPNGVCGEAAGNTGGTAFVCDGGLVTVVGGCARTVKAANLFATNEELRPLVQACVYEDAEIQANVTPQCLGCFLDVAECAGDNCILECLAGDSPDCDACRMNNNCEQPLFACAGFPNPL